MNFFLRASLSAFSLALVARKAPACSSELTQVGWAGMALGARFLVAPRFLEAAGFLETAGFSAAEGFLAAGFLEVGFLAEGFLAEVLLGYRIC
jgi:hypothetical protein